MVNMKIARFHTFQIEITGTITVVLNQNNSFQVIPALIPITFLHDYVFSKHEEKIEVDQSWRLIASKGAERFMLFSFINLTNTLW